jgi:hypothetical protein
MSQREMFGRSSTKVEYEPLGSSRKLALLLLRSFRYSYRQRCCQCCPAILCEFLLPIIVLGLLILSRYGANSFLEFMNNSNNTKGLSIVGRQCPQDLNTPSTSSNDLFAKCFQFPPSYEKSAIQNLLGSYTIPNKTNLIFQPITADVNELVGLASKRLSEIHCPNTKVW